MSRAPNRLQFRDPKTPFSEKFGDIYFSNEAGIEESIYVYLEGSGALAAIQNGTPLVRIGEIGFGVGLNFLLTLRAFLSEAKPEQRLHYVSAEKFPIEAEDLLTLYEAYPELLPFARELLDQYPILTPGNHRLFFAGGRLTLDLMIGDATELFESHDFKADFWYFDGFAPSKNPDAFSDPIFSAVQKRSNLGARGTSFTAATWVRHCLEARGFQVSKRKGYGKKRECIEAVLMKEAEVKNDPAWFSRNEFTSLKAGDTVAILGAGLAGTAIARALANRGYHVQVFDGNGIANRASSNSVGLFNVQLSKKINPISRFSQASFTHLKRELESLQIPKLFGIARPGKEDVTECLNDTGYPRSFYEVRENDVFLPQCGMINPRTLCEARMNHELISFLKKTVVKVERTENECILIDSEAKEIGRANHVVYALGADLTLGVSSLHHENLEASPMRAIRGQTLLLRPNSESAGLKEVLVNEGYVSPVAKNITGHECHLVGATFQAKEILPNQEALDREQLSTEAKEKWSFFANLSDKDIVSDKVGFRASTPDKLPLIGPMSSESFSKENYAHALRGAAFNDLPALKVSPGEWMITGLGSRGIPFSSLGAEILASLMTGMPLPIETDLFHHLHPVRFTIRTIKKNH